MSHRWRAGAQAPLRKRLRDVPGEAGALVQALRGDRVRAAPDLASPAAVSALLFEPRPGGLGLAPPPSAHRNKSGAFSTADAVRAPQPSPNHNQGGAFCTANAVCSAGALRLAGYRVQGTELPLRYASGRGSPRHLRTALRPPGARCQRPRSSGPAAGALRQRVPGPDR